ncbi:hypothetical protein [Halobacillus amylolyticus]|uniref:Uncharacterized protein n=1 Tax=Halobacillus amylolyticus TaxID=2932259 RepID=A0ABY4HDQ1_9BACI|nr:hypothetical protein [Halobacillus amylolyticus]UOR12030.1 hypothetical protein MUO15_00335 [Halobacillus amylolyticus]
MNRTSESDIVLSSISNLRKDYDEVLGLLRDEDNRQRNNTLLWIFKPFLRALFNYTPFMPKDKSTVTTKITSSSLLQHLGIIGIIFNNSNLLNNLLWIAAIVFFIISVVINFKREVTIYDEYFDISAFRNLEKVIHTKLVSKYVESAPFTFNLLYDYIRDLIQNSSDHLAQMIKDNKEKEEENSNLRQELEKAKVTVSSMRKSLNHQINLQSHLNRTILRITEGTFDKDDLMIVCEFSLFKEEGTSLLLIHPMV